MLKFLKRENRSLENPQIPISSSAILSFFGLDEASAAGESVTIDTALGVPAIWAAVSFLSGTLAVLPLQVFRKTDAGREQVDGGINDILHDAPNDEMSSFEWRKYTFEQVFTGGRGVTFIERKSSGEIINLWPIDPSKVTYISDGRKRSYRVQNGGSAVVYGASEIIDLPFFLKPNGLDFRSPILSHADVIGMAIALTKYAGRFFAGGGVPPFAIEGPFQSPAAMQRAGDDLAAAMAKAAKEKRAALALPAGHTIKSLGVNPDKAHMIEASRFIIEQIARIYSLPPTFLQDLTRSTFSNSEQQDLHFVKHTLLRWVEQFEQQLNLKLFGRSNPDMYVELNVDGLLRGDFQGRMQGYAQGVQNAILTPNEIRRMENFPDAIGGDDLMIQGATVPIGQQEQK